MDKSGNDIHEQTATVSECNDFNGCRYKEPSLVLFFSAKIGVSSVPLGGAQRCKGAGFRVYGVVFYGVVFGRQEQGRRVLLDTSATSDRGLGQV